MPLYLGRCPSPWWRVECGARGESCAYGLRPEEIRFIPIHISLSPTSYLLLPASEGQGRDAALWEGERPEKFSCAWENRKYLTLMATTAKYVQALT